MIGPELISLESIKTKPLFYSFAISILGQLLSTYCYPTSLPLICSPQPNAHSTTPLPQPNQSSTLSLLLTLLLFRYPTTLLTCSPQPTQHSLCHFSAYSLRTYPLAARPNKNSEQNHN